MATFDATDLATRHRHVGPFGDATQGYGTVTPTAGALNDQYRPVRIPAGIEVTAIILRNDDLDTNGSPTLTFSMGYSPVDGSNPAENLTYFAAAASTELQAAAVTRFEDFDPIKFEYDVWVVLDLDGAAATFASGDVQVRYEGINHGVK